MNRVEPIDLTLALRESRPDVFLLAGRYSLLDHDRALQRVCRRWAESGLDAALAVPPLKPAICGKVQWIKFIADRYGMSMKAAGL